MDNNYNISKSRFDWLKHFDMFGVDFNFSLSQHEKFKSKTGGIWFITYLIVMIMISTIFLYNFFQNKKYTILTSENIMVNKDMNESINMSKEKFNFAMMPPDLKNASNFNFSDIFKIETSFNIRVSLNDTYYVDKLKKENYKEKYDTAYTITFSKKLNEKKCDISQFFSNSSKNLIEDYLINQFSKEIKCFDIDDELYLKGSFYEKIFSYIKLSVLIKNSFLKETKEKLKINLIFSNNIVDNKNFESEQMLENIYEIMDNSSIINYDFFLKRHIYTSESNILFESENNQEILKVKEIKRTQSKIQEDRDYHSIFNVFFRSSNSFTEIKRKRQKIIDTVQLICTISVNNFLIINFIISFINRRKGKQHVIGRIIKSKEDLMQNVPNEIHKIKDLIFEKNENLNSNEGNVFYSKLRNYIKMEKKRLSCNLDFMRKSNIKNISNDDKNNISMLNIILSRQEIDKPKTNISTNKDKIIDDNELTFHKSISSPSLDIKSNLNETIELDEIFLQNYDIDRKKENDILESTSYFSGRNKTIKLTESKKSTFINDSQNKFEKSLKMPKAKLKLNEIIEENENDSENENSKEMQKSFNDLMGLDNQTDNNKNEKISEKSPPYKSNLEKTSKRKRNPSVKIKFSFLRFLKLIFCCKFKEIARENKEYERGEKKFNEYIDLVNYMKKMQELDILKYLILNENMLNLVRFISRPSISKDSGKQILNEYQKFFEPYEENYNDNDIFANIRQSYSNLKNKDNKDNLETRIIQLFENQIIDICGH